MPNGSHLPRVLEWIIFYYYNISLMVNDKCVDLNNVLFSFMYVWYLAGFATNVYRQF